jgi:NAD dependent epimerase/dehydratase
MAKKIFVTGASGFIGSHLVELLLQKNYFVTALCPYSTDNSIGWLENIKKTKKLKIINGDICDEDFITRVTENHEAIIHLAALISIPYSYLSPRTYVSNNIMGTLNILEAGRKNKIKKILHTSTSEVYGSAQYSPIDEKHPLVAQSPYSASKISSDKLAESYYRSFGLEVAIIRPFNTFGPRQSTRAVIPTIITQVLKNKKIIKLGSINTKRDFTFVEDTAKGFIKALETKNIGGETINLGTGTTFSIKEIIEVIREYTKKKFLIKLDSKRIRPKKSEVNLLISNNNKAKKILKWKPEYYGKKGFKIALKKTVDWFSDEGNLKLYNDKYNV